MVGRNKRSALRHLRARRRNALRLLRPTGYGLKQGKPMITPAYCRTMAAYNSEMNRRLYAAASRLSDAERAAPRAARSGARSTAL
jgi:hypothetical protein